MKIATQTETLISGIGTAMAEGRWADVMANVAPHVIAHVPALNNLTFHLVRLEGMKIAEIWFQNFDGAAVAAFWA